jgi:hypothetical protein
MAAILTRPHTPRWYLIPVRVVLVAFLMTLLSFAISLLIGILGVVIHAGARGIHPNMTLAYRHVALPTAIVVAALALIVMSILEIRDYRQAKVLAEIERRSR